MPIREINIPSEEKIQELLKELAEKFPDQMEKASEIIADRAQAFWMNLARKSSKNKDGSTSKWGENYAKAIQKEELSGGGYKLFVDDNDPNFKSVKTVEEGIETWNIKDALLKGKAARRNAEESPYGTLYVRVPFQWRTPAKTEPGGKTKFAGTMPRNIYEMVKRGEKIGEEAGVLAGLVKMGGPLHSQFMTFRTVSEKSSGWIYPGREGVNVFEQVKKKVESMIKETIENMILGLLKDLKEQGI